MRRTRVYTIAGTRIPGQIGNLLLIRLIDEPNNRVLCILPRAPTYMYIDSCYDIKKVKFV